MHTKAVRNFNIRGASARKGIDLYFSARATASPPSYALSTTERPTLAKFLKWIKAVNIRSSKRTKETGYS